VLWPQMGLGGGHLSGRPSNKGGRAAKFPGAPTLGITDLLRRPPLARL
jgi:hypothetical protein